MGKQLSDDLKKIGSLFVIILALMTSAVVIAEKNIADENNSINTGGDQKDVISDRTIKDLSSSGSTFDSVEFNNVTFINVTFTDFTIQNLTINNRQDAGGTINYGSGVRSTASTGSSTANNGTVVVSAVDSSTRLHPSHSTSSIPLILARVPQVKDRVPQVQDRVPEIMERTQGAP